MGWGGRGDEGGRRAWVEARHQDGVRGRGRPQGGGPNPPTPAPPPPAAPPPPPPRRAEGPGQEAGGGAGLGWGVTHDIAAPNYKTTILPIREESGCYNTRIRHTKEESKIQEKNPAVTIQESYLLGKNPTLIRPGVGWGGRGGGGEHIGGTRGSIIWNQLYPEPF